MTAQNNNEIHLLMPPEFDYLPGLFLPDLVRARCMARVVLLLTQLREQGYDVTLDAGSQSMSAAETASQLKAAGVENIILAGSPGDVRGAEILGNALTEEGLSQASALIIDPDSEKDFLDLKNAICARASAGKTPVKRELLASASNSVFMLYGKTDPAAGLKPIFRQGEKSIERCGAGAVASIPAEVDTIRTCSANPPFMEADGIKAGSVLHVLALTEEAADDTALLEVGTRLAGIAGADRLRLMPLPRYNRCGGADWAARYGLDQPRMRSRIDSLVVRFFPQQQVYWNVVKVFFELGEDPLEEMYAGNSLPDRNAELIENIVP